MKTILNILIFSSSFSLAQCDTTLLYFNSGLVQAKGCMKDNLKEGLWVYYQEYKSAPFDSMGIYLKGKKNGLWKYFAGGTGSIIIAEGEFKNDTKVGYWKEGVFEGKYVNGLKEGRWICYTAKDSIHIDEINYKNGVIHGVSKAYYDNGVLRYSLYFENGLPSGKYLKYSSKGKLMGEGQFKNGKECGEWKNYDDDGMLVSKGIYKFGLKCGTWTYYGEKGNPTKEEHYDNKGMLTQTVDYK